MLARTAGHAAVFVVCHSFPADEKLSPLSRAAFSAFSDVFQHPLLVFFHRFRVL